MRYISIEFGYTLPTVIALCNNGIAESILLSQKGLTFEEVAISLRDVQRDIKVAPYLPVAIDKAEPKLIRVIRAAGFEVIEVRVDVTRPAGYKDVDTRIVPNPRVKPNELIR